MVALSDPQVEEIKDAIRILINQLEVYNEKLGNMTLREIANNRDAIREFEFSIKELLQINHPGIFDSSFLDKKTINELINIAISSLRDLLTKIISVEIETAAENIKEGIGQVNMAKKKADDALHHLNDIRKALQILAKFINLAGAIAVAVAAPNIGTVINVAHTAGDLIGLSG